jgi:ABC-type nitrate/sulfonate/bicarbonate transport system substrate-binding protein
MAELGQLGIPFSQDLIEVKKASYKSEPKTIEAFLRAYIAGVAALNTDNQMARKVFAKYMKTQSVDEALELATKYLEKVPRVDPAVIQTVLNWIFTITRLLINSCRKDLSIDFTRNKKCRRSRS